MTKYIAQIVEEEGNGYYINTYLKPIKKFGITKLEDFDYKLFGTFGGIRLRSNQHEYLKTLVINELYTFEVEDSALSFENEEILQNNKNSSDETKIYGKNCYLNDYKETDDGEKIKLSLFEKDEDKNQFAELFKIDASIQLDKLYRYIKNIRLNHIPITNLIYITDGTKVMGPFTWEHPDANYLIFSIIPHNSEDYRTDVYRYIDFRQYAVEIETKYNDAYSLILNKTIEENIKIDSTQDCMPLEDIAKQFLKNSTSNLLSKESILEYCKNEDNSLFSEERKNKLINLLTQHEIDKNQYNDFIKNIASNNEILNQIAEYTPASSVNIGKIEEYKNKISELEEANSDKDRKITSLEEQNKILAKKEDLEEENIKLKNEIQSLKDLEEENIKLKNEIQSHEDLESLQQQSEELKAKINELQSEERNIIYHTQVTIDNFRENLRKEFSNLNNKVLGTQVDTKILEIILEESSKQNRKDFEENVAILKFNENEKHKKFLEPKEFIEYLHTKFKQARRNYSKNDIANIIICLSQGFLTIFAGEPGTGKTSFVKSLAKFMGLTQANKRYVEVSVEKGWTSKRDFLGFYNPLTKEFNPSNKELFNGFVQLEKEENANVHDFPFIVLLDEANLSPMEYYWADFMKICDYSNVEQCKISLFEGKELSISKNLKFLATINLDHTTESLSPRLIDRSWIIKLPNQDFGLNDDFGCLNFDNEEYYLVHNSVLNYINKKELRENYKFKIAVGNKFDKIKEVFKEVNILFSPRVISMIKNYCIAADELKLMETNNNELIPLDYAIAQKILPMIDGQGDKYEELIEKLIALTPANQMPVSNKILQDIKQKAKNNGMKYYQFFAR